MSRHLTNQSRKVLALANNAARSFNHTYVGTEHILLALIEDGSGDVSDVLAMQSIDADKIRAEIERLIHRGTEPVALRTLPLTPRAQQAIELAGDEARYLDEKCVGPEHLLLGLVREGTGVACQVLLNLGIRPEELRAEVFKIRMAQMKIVERAIRPVRASTPRKRKMREELLAHLSAIYDQEQNRLHNPATALAAATERFGNPAELACELEAALPYHERFSHFIERWIAWQAPETVARYALRLSVGAFCILAVVLGLVSTGLVLRYGWVADVRTTLRMFAAILLIAPPAQFVVYVLYFKMRDSLWGVFGSRKSVLRVFLCDLLIGLLSVASLVALTAVATWDRTKITELLTSYITAGFAGAAFCYLMARISGPTEIRDTMWAMLDVEG